MSAGHSPQTAIEKIAQRHAVDLDPGEVVRAGAFLNIRPRHIMTHDNTSAVMGKFKEIGAARIADPRQPVFAMDHDVQNITPENLGKYAKIQQFAREQGVDYYPPGRGIAHQVMVEEGYVTPGAMVVGSDSHSNLYGAAAALGTPVVRTDAAAIWATGQTWWQVPELARVTLTGRLRQGATGKDVIIALCGHFNHDEALNFGVEFAGDGVAGLSVEQRMTISNMTTEWGTLIGMFPFDEVLRDFLLERADFFKARAEKGGPAPRYTREDVDRWWSERADISADEDAFYSRELTLDLSTVIPHVAGPNEVKTITSLPEIEKRRVRINKAYLMSCVNARLGDIELAASIMRGKKVAEGVEFYLAAASSEVQRIATEKGWWQDLLNAGAIELPSGCGACIGLGRGTLEPGEVGVSATNRNFEGRMGSREADCYLASPAVVAASAISGYICAPERVESTAVRGECRSQKPAAGSSGAVRIREGFPARISGRALFLPKDNLNTDGIYGKDVTYRDDLTPEQMAAAAFANYDPSFQKIAKSGDIIVGARNFGTGSSREQAATALKHFGVALVIAASINQTYSRNAFNNGFICIECPDLSDALAARFSSEAEKGDRTIAGPGLEIDFEKSFVRCEGAEYPFAPLSPVAQELIVAGGSESVVKERLAAV
ncbi:MAG: homoaconitase [Phycisphaeraceae bacterium]|nr:MAG: homoaconitase [Phycisphaeraceae bacterium]